MKKKFTNSSQVNEIEYNENTKVLTVVFKSGTYDYKDVPKEIAEEAFDPALPSIGSWIGTKIKKGGYEYVKVA